MSSEDRPDNVGRVSRQGQLRARLDLYLKAYSVIGVLIAIFSGVYFVFTFLDFQLSVEQQLSLMVSGVGITVAVLSRALIVLNREKARETLVRSQGQEALYALVETWSRFERVSKNLFPVEDGKFNRRSPRSVVLRLCEEGMISSVDVEVIETAMRVRNDIVHGQHPPPVELAADLTEQLERIVSGLADP